MGLIQYVPIGYNGVDHSDSTSTVSGLVGEIEKLLQ
jgi:hypothetical protein